MSWRKRQDFFAPPANPAEVRRRHFQDEPRALLQAGEDALRGAAGGGGSVTGRGHWAPFRRRTNIVQKHGSRQQSSHRLRKRNRRGADRAPPSRRRVADIDRTASPTAAPVRKTASLVSKSRGRVSKNRELISRNRGVLRAQGVSRHSCPSRPRR